jgi:hypothetical protein
MDRLPTEVQEAIVSQDYVIGLIFFKPRSPQWPLVKAMLQNTDKFIERQSISVALFKASKQSINIAWGVYSMVNTWKSVHCFTMWRKIHGLWEIRWLECYIKALKCDDKKAHCCRVITDPAVANSMQVMTISLELEKPKTPRLIVVQDKYITPCSNITSYRWGDPNHPSSYKDQFQAHAVYMGVDDCPLFDISGFRKA